MGWRGGAAGLWANNNTALSYGPRYFKKKNDNLFLGPRSTHKTPCGAQNHMYQSSLITNLLLISHISAPLRT